MDEKIISTMQKFIIEDLNLVIWSLETGNYIYQIRESEDSRVLEAYNKTSDTWKILFWDWGKNYNFSVVDKGNVPVFILFYNHDKTYQFEIRQ